MNDNVTTTAPDASALTPSELAQLIDHTLLKPESSPADAAALAREAEQLGTYSICVSPSMLPIDTTVHVATVCGFPSGQHAPEVKAAEAKLAVDNGADEVDMVINVGRAAAGDADFTEAEIRAVRDAIPGAVLKVIIESAALSDEQIVASCRAAKNAGADFVKTSTGFHPAGGASAHAVRLMRDTVGEDLGVKASGGIRTLAAAREMIAAGANRLGLSGSAAILEEAAGGQQAGGAGLGGETESITEESQANGY
ncbi:deoxyribose-phosphate aldolase [Helcobacillus massiliensis]|uniref:deoxyribose-phosphate aldolase n=1 Tax=Helcobacillus massiliensis TaxID=521392 RepID=UPI002552C6C7|nr:deoxyribose-phosphate aldolase [Helcobacillus massiliensis]MDK7742807.1 deoxyribose-phosphate aldolase [Helcobacillus massiliensis]WOO93458.1 deoxyribose-phosphate aldolase [Helcobacillus massiliensis]